MMFKSWDSYSAFSRAIQHGNRYIHDEEVRAFLDTVLTTSKKREKTLKEGSILWRAQLGNDWRPIYEESERIAEEPIPFPEERMKPIPFSATEGRANPKGIPYLYLATYAETAMSEVRPWLGAQISVGQFKMKKELHLIDCSVHQKKSSMLYFKEPDVKKRERSVWSYIDQAFSEPVDPSDQTSDYVPTQIIAEKFKSAGCDGIVYKSALSAGFNVALFDLEVAYLISCALSDLKSIKYKFTAPANPYFVRSGNEKNNT